MRQAIQQDPTFGSPYARLAYAMILEMELAFDPAGVVCTIKALVSRTTPVATQHDGDSNAAKE